MRRGAWLLFVLGSCALLAAETPAARQGVMRSRDAARQTGRIEPVAGGPAAELHLRPGDLELPWVGRTLRYEVVESGGRTWADAIFPAEPEELRRVAEVTESLRRLTVDRGRLVTRLPNDLAPDMALWDQDARLVFKKDLLGAPFAVNFIFTSCRSAKMCPASTACMKQLAEELAQVPRAQAVRLLTITFDPEFDSPGVLRSYAQGYGIDSRRHRFLTGDAGQVRDLMKHYGILTVRDDGTIVHNAALILVNAQGRIVQRREGASFDAAEVAKVLTGMVEAR
jgi:protein SCO1/2